MPQVTPFFERRRLGRVGVGMLIWLTCCGGMGGESGREQWKREKRRSLSFSNRGRVMVARGGPDQISRAVWLVGLAVPSIPEGEGDSRRRIWALGGGGTACAK